MDSWAKLDTGLVMTVLGMGVVFTVLVFLCYAFNLLEIVCKPRTGKPGGAGGPDGSDKPAPRRAADGDALVAAIAAAVASCTPGKPRVAIRPLSRCGERDAWERAGREDQMASRRIGGFGKRGVARKGSRKGEEGHAQEVQGHR